MTFPLRPVTIPNPTEHQRKHTRELDAALPSVCVRHGRQGTWRRGARIVSHPHVPWDDLSVGRKILHDMRPGGLRKRSVARWLGKIWVPTDWAVCPACRWYLIGRRALSVVLVALTAYLITGPISPLALWMPADLRPALHLIGIPLALPTIRSMSTYKELFRAVVSEDGTTLEVQRPHPDFTVAALAMGAGTQEPTKIPTEF